MAIYYSLGNALVDNEELKEKHLSGDLEKFSKNIASGAVAS